MTQDRRSLRMLAQLPPSGALEPSVGSAAADAAAIAALAPGGAALSVAERLKGSGGRHNR